MFGCEACAAVGGGVGRCVLLLVALERRVVQRTRAARPSPNGPTIRLNTQFYFGSRDLIGASCCVAGIGGGVAATTGTPAMLAPVRSCRPSAAITPPPAIRAFHILIQGNTLLLWQQQGGLVVVRLSRGGFWTPPTVSPDGGLAEGASAVPLLQPLIHTLGVEHCGRGGEGRGGHIISYRVGQEPHRMQ